MSSKAQNVRSINCTQCSAPLKLYGGHQVKSVNCGYCGSVLDAMEEYKVVKEFKGVSRPSSPIKIGMHGRIKGVRFTVIGMIEYASIDSKWINLQLFSPTHGYAWLEHEDGHFVFSRSVRDMPTGLKRHHIKSNFKARGRTFRVFDYYDTTVTFVEGELTWIAAKGDKVSITDGIDPPYIFSAEKTGNELEYSFGEYLHPLEVYKAFSLKGKPERRKEVHAAQPFLATAFETGLSKAAMYFVPIAFVLYLIILGMGGGKTIYTTSLSPDKFLNGAETNYFTVTDADRLLGLYLHSNLSNAWLWIDVTIANEQQELYSLAKQISYYSGYEGGEHWSEGSKDVKAYFKLPKPGKYQLFVAGEGGTGNRGTTAQKKSLMVSIKEGVIVSRYLLYLLIITSISALFVYFRKWIFEQSRWSDEDDDD